MNDYTYGISLFLAEMRDLGCLGTLDCPSWGVCWGCLLARLAFHG
jgi:hypothetical protein